MNMKITKNASGKTKIKISKSEWETIGTKMGWMKKANCNYHQDIYYTITINGQEYDIIVGVRITRIENDGIGPYEFWGAKGYDKGQNYIDDFDIENVKMDSGNPDIDFLPEQKAKIIKILENSPRFNDKVQEEISVDDITQDAQDQAEAYKYDSAKDEYHLRN